MDEVIRTLGLAVSCAGSSLGREVKGGYVGDLLSDVMANSKEGDLWITRQVHQNIVAVASLKDLAGIVLIQGSEPAPDTAAKANAEGIPILVTDLPAFEIVGRIYKLIHP
ncbi:MAG: DRTGG domain-containing protein [Syntrophales bacterium]|nr:DRTGG domain-containing protein [Syntrophales bacterium]